PRHSWGCGRAVERRARSDACRRTADDRLHGSADARCGVDGLDRELARAEEEQQDAAQSPRAARPVRDGALSGVAAMIRIAGIVTLLCLIAIVAAGIALAMQNSRPVSYGDAQRGEALRASYGCLGCHARGR